MLKELCARQAREFRRQPSLLTIELGQLTLLATPKQPRIDTSHGFERGSACADFPAQHSFDC